MDHKIESFFFFFVIEIKMNFNLVIKIAKTKGEWLRAPDGAFESIVASICFSLLKLILSLTSITGCRKYFEFFGFLIVIFVSFDIST